MLGQRIKEYLDENGIKYSYVADEIGIQKSTFSAMLNGRRKIVADEYFDICRVLRVELGFFMEDEKKQKASTLREVRK